MTPGKDSQIRAVGSVVAILQLEIERLEQSNADLVRDAVLRDCEAAGLRARLADLAARVEPPAPSRQTGKRPPERKSRAPGKRK